MFRTTSHFNLDVDNDNSAEEIFQGYKEELEDDSASHLLSDIVDRRGDDRPALSL
ncbi:hypothetical protein IscW_ISCW023025 [Ixodes scapularis]|uniref:Uncharacterized protein n=1 Tax=Ixodes scapularis TaxID=6945 RepID=B7QH21_IXOSC|nr:hypothetical protein IscW_ISCW023025 [Ixodes scapularis]|eukprot:XP_002414478.1 hypothetical protein IscW_ISCW023025 [Ixodes scapularis]